MLARESGPTWVASSVKRRSPQKPLTDDIFDFGNGVELVIESVDQQSPKPSEKESRTEGDGHIKRHVRTLGFRPGYGRDQRR